MVLTHVEADRPFRFQTDQNKRSFWSFKKALVSMYSSAKTKKAQYKSEHRLLTRNNDDKCTRGFVSHVICGIVLHLMLTCSEVGPVD